MTAFININNAAGNDLYKASFTLRCMITEPNNKVVKPILPIKVKYSNLIDAIKMHAKLIFKKPTT